MSLRRLFLISGLALTLLVWTRPSSSTLIASSTPTMHLHRSYIDLSWAPMALKNLAIIQFSEPISTDNRNALAATGVDILEYLPDFAYLVRGDEFQLAAAAELPYVVDRAAFTTADKMAPSLLTAVRSNTVNLTAVRLFGWQGERLHNTTMLQQAGIEATGMGTAVHLQQLAALPAVRWMEPATTPHLLNDQARTIMQVEPVWDERHFFGTGQVVAIADSGLDTGDPATISPDFAGRILSTYAQVDGETWDDNFGHGTHVAGSLAGAGVQSGAAVESQSYAGSFAGVAPEANLVIQAFEVTDGGEIMGLDDDFYTLFAQAYADGARLHSNSWGDQTGSDEASAYGGYPFGAQRTDAFVWEHPDMTIFAAAGNSGRDGMPGALGLCEGGDGVIDPDSLLSPATAKNVVSVGATESERSDTGAGGIPWLLFIGSCFWTNPIAGDLVADNADGMAAFSSRGPTDDGRIKPDIVAPGTNILSNRSHVEGANELWGVHEVNEHYVYSGGTSMATPLVAGVGTLIREWLQTQGAVNPGAALVKAVLLNTAQAIAPGQYGEGSTQEIPYQLPNSVAGWGRADLGFLGEDDPFTIWVDDHTAGLETGGLIVYEDGGERPLTVITDTHPLRITLVWTDPPASLSATRQLVNDLDLVVTGPDGTIYYGNEAAGGDRVNNVEGIVISQPAVGNYRIEIQAYNVPIETQPFALVVSGALGGVVAPPEAPEFLFLPLIRNGT